MLSLHIRFIVISFAHTGQGAYISAVQTFQSCFLCISVSSSFRLLIQGRAHIYQQFRPFNHTFCISVSSSFRLLISFCVVFVSLAELMMMILVLLITSAAMTFITSHAMSPDCTPGNVTPLFPQLCGVPPCRWLRMFRMSVQGQRWSFPSFSRLFRSSV